MVAGYVRGSSVSDVSNQTEKPVGPLSTELDFGTTDLIDDFSDGLLDERSKKLVAPPVSIDLPPPPDLGTDDISEGETSGYEQ